MERRTTITYVTLLMLVCLAPMSLHAQKKEKAMLKGNGLFMDAIYLKNGSVIRGDIIEQDSSQLKIESGLNLFVFSFEEVSVIKHEWISNKELRQNGLRSGIRKKEIHIPQKGMYFFNTISLLNGRYEDLWGEYETNGAAIHSGLGYRFHSALGVGLGSGVNFISNDVKVLPVFAEIRGDIGQAQVTPHYYVQGGYGFPITGSVSRWTRRGEWIDADTQGGWIGDAGIGFHIHTASQLSYIFTLGYRIQDFFIGYETENEISSEHLRSRRLNIQFGILF